MKSDESGGILVTVEALSRIALQTQIILADVRAQLAQVVKDCSVKSCKNVWCQRATSSSASSGTKGNSKKSRTSVSKFPANEKSTTLSKHANSGGAAVPRTESVQTPADGDREQPMDVLLEDQTETGKEDADANQSGKEDSGASPDDGDGWIPASQRRRKKRVSSKWGSGDRGAGELRVLPVFGRVMKALHVTGYAEEVSAVDMRGWLNKQGIHVQSVWKLNSSRRGSVFCIEFTDRDFVEVLKEAFWPRGVAFRRWLGAPPRGTSVVEDFKASRPSGKQ